MGAYSDLLPDILPHVPSCPLPSITRALQVIAQDFFQRSEAYTHTITSVNTVSGQPNVTVSLPANTRLVKPLDMYLGAGKLATTNEQILANDYGNWRALTGIPKFVMISDTVANQLILALPPDGVYALTGRVAVKPLRAATTLDDNLMELYGDALVDGVLHRLMMMKNTEWYDGNLAQYHSVQYESAIDEAHDVSNKTNTSRILSTGYGGI